MIALGRIAEGTPIRQASTRPGYERSGSFVTMFRKAVGMSPACFAHSKTKKMVQTAFLNLDPLRECA
jgi:AraC-like DNA-binding protein